MKNKRLKKFFSLVIVFAMMFTVMMPIGVAYALPATISILSTIANGASNPSIQVTLTSPLDTFTLGASDATNNWDIDCGTTTLGVSSITIDTSTSVTINFIGVAAAGTVTVQAKDGALTGAVPGDISNPFPVVVTAISTVSTIANAASNPSIVVNLVGDTFTAGALIDSNWDIHYGTTTLTGVSLITKDPTSTIATITFIGTAVAGTVTVQAKAGALTGANPVDVSNIIPVAVTAISTTSAIANAASDPPIVVNLVGDTFAVGALIDSNWDIDYGTTSLTGVSSITKDPGSTIATITFTGTASAGTVTVQAKAGALNGASPGDVSNLISIVVPSATNAVTILKGVLPLTNLNATDISKNGASIGIKLTSNKWNKDIIIDGTSGPIFENLYPTLKSCFKTLENATQWNTLLNSASFACSPDLKTITMTILPQAYNIQSSQNVTFTPKTSLLQDLNIGTPASQPSFNIIADYAKLSGTLTSGATQSKIISGGETLIITLTNCLWASDAIIAANKANLFNAFESSATNTAGWDKVQAALNSVNNPISIINGRSTMIITLPAVPSYTAYVPQTITLSSLDGLLLTDTSTVSYSTVPLKNISSNSFVISPQDTTSTTVSWAAALPTKESEIVAGGQVLTMQLSNNTWASDLVSDSAKQKVLLDSFTTATDSAAWENVKASILAVTTRITLTTTVPATPLDTLTITLPTIADYSILANQTIEVNVPPTVLKNNYGFSPNPLSFTITADPAVGISGTLTEGVINELDIVNGGKTIVATLTNATWDPLVTTDRVKREALIDSLLKTPTGLELGLPTWAATWTNLIATVKAGATYTLKEDLSTVTVTLPSVTKFNISNDLSIFSIIPPITVTNPAVTQISTLTAFNIAPVKNQSATISGSVTTATESDIVAGGKTLSISLNNDVWAQSVTSTGVEFESSTLTFPTTLISPNVVKSGDNKVLTITLPAVPGFNTQGIDQTINVKIPSTSTSTNASVISAGSFTIKAVTAALSGTAVTAPLDSTSVITGGKTIVITLTNATWASDVTTAARVSELMGCFRATPSAVNWSNVSSKITASNVTLTGKNILIIKLPPNPTYNWNETLEKVAFEIPRASLLNLLNEKLGSTRDLKASLNLSIGQTLQSTITASLSLSDASMNMAVSDIVAGTASKSFRIQLTNGSWDPLLPTNSAKIGALVGGFTANSDSTSWAMVQKALKSPTMITNHSFVLGTTSNTNDTLTIKLPAVPGYDLVKSQIIRLTIPRTVLVPATVNVLAVGEISIIVPSYASSVTLQSKLDDGSLVNDLSTISLQKIFLIVPTKLLTSVVSKQSTFDNTIINSVDIYTDSSVDSVNVNVLADGKDYPSITYINSGNGRKFNVGFATVKTTSGSTTTSSDAIVSVLCGTVKSDVTMKIGSSKVYAPTTDLSGTYSLYKLMNNTSLMTNILKYYVPADITVVTT